MKERQRRALKSMKSPCNPQSYFFPLKNLPALLGLAGAGGGEVVSFKSSARAATAGAPLGFLAGFSGFAIPFPPVIVIGKGHQSGRVWCMWPSICHFTPFLSRLLSNPRQVYFPWRKGHMPQLVDTKFILRSVINFPTTPGWREAPAVFVPPLQQSY